MDEPRHPKPKPWRSSPGYLVAAALIVALGLGYGFMSSAPPVVVIDTAAPVPLTVAATAPALDIAPRAPVASSTPVAAAPSLAEPPLTSPQQISRMRDPNGDQSPDISDYANPGERPTMREVIDRLHQAGVHSGLGAFSPPGTRPPLVGLAVPENFELPPGYVRHYQATDDGQRIEPVLMFAPDYQPVDASGRPITMPKDRVVPPELAPPGLPNRRIAIPAPTEPGRPGS